MSQLPHITHAEHEGVQVVSPVGDFDLSAVDLLRSVLLDTISAPNSRLIIDLSQTTFLDSMAPGAILGARKRAAGWGGWVRLVAPPSNVCKVLRVTELDTLFGLYDNVDQAFRHVQLPDTAAHRPRSAKTPQQMTNAVAQA